jgi:hypothetical protein
MVPKNERLFSPYLLCPQRRRYSACVFSPAKQRNGRNGAGMFKHEQFGQNLIMSTPAVTDISDGWGWRAI